MRRYEIALQPNVSEVPRLLDWAEAIGSAEGIAHETMLRVALALEEAVTNVIRHGFSDVPAPHLLRVRLEIEAGNLTAEVLDNGRPFDPSAVPEPVLSKIIEDRAAGGVGIHLMRDMTDRIDYRHEDGLNRLTLVKRLMEPPPE